MEPMRFAIAYDCLFPFTTGGGERQYRAFAEELGGRGIKVDYLTSQQWVGAIPDTPGFRVVAASGPLRLYDADGVRRTTAALSFAWGLFRTLRRRRRDYDVVMVSALPVLNVFAVRAALIGSGTTVIADYLEVWGRRQWLEYAGPVTGTVAWILQRIAIALTPIATCHSSLSARRLKAEGLRREPLVSPGLLVGDEAEPVSYAASEPPFALYVGRHIPDKRVETLPAAVAHARTQVPGLRLVILGSGPSRDEVQVAVASQPGAVEWTSMPGFVSEDELTDLLSTAMCVVNPSRREGYGLVIVEANAHGTPAIVVAGEGNASTELISEGANGYIAPDASPIALGDTIARTARAGAALRSTTRDWYRDALTTRSVARTIDAVLRHLEKASAPTPGRRRK